MLCLPVSSAVYAYTQAGIIEAGVGLLNYFLVYLANGVSASDLVNFNSGSDVTLSSESPPSPGVRDSSTQPRGHSQAESGLVACVQPDYLRARRVGPHVTKP